MANQQGERIVIDDERIGNSLNDQPYIRDEYFANPERIAMLDKLLEDSISAVIWLYKEGPDRCSCDTYEDGGFGNRMLFVSYTTDDTKYVLQLVLDDEGKIDLSERRYLEAFKIYSTQRAEYITVSSRGTSEGSKFIVIERATRNPETGIVENVAGLDEVETVGEAKKMEEGADTDLRTMLGLPRN